MATPFDFTASAAQTFPTPDRTGALATAPQLGFIGKLIASQDWQSAAPAYVARVATISATIHLAELIAADPSRVDGRVEVTDPADTAGTFAELMTHALGVAEADGNAELIAQRKPLTKRGASALIDWLQGQPVKVTPAAEHLARVATPGPGIDVAASRAEADRIAGVPDADTVPAGRYAIDTADGATNALAFYRVDRPTEGRWAGRVFVKLITGGDEQRLSWATTQAVLVKIAEAGAAQASARYGHEIGACGVCGRQLTNDESRAAGIGPVCRANMGW